MLMGKRKKLLALKPSNIVTLIETWLKLLLVWASFSCLPQSTATQIWFREGLVVNKKEGSSPNSEQEEIIKKNVNLLQIAVSHHIVKLTCLHRVLVLKNMMEKNGIEASIVIGVRKDKNALAAHAWLQIGNNIIADKKSYTDQFKPLDDQSSASLMLLDRQRET
jgi:hypothetical protein